MKLNTVVALAAIAAGVTACADDPVQPTAARVPAPNAAVSAANRTVVEFNGPVRKDFAARVASLGGTVDFVSESGGFATVSGLTADGTAALEKTAGVSAVYPDVAVQLGPSPELGGALTGEVGAMSPTNPAAALGFGLQWNMQAIHAPEAWAAGNLGSPNVTAAIIDSGIDYDAFDLNGLVDLSRSVSFVPSDDAILDTYFPTRNKVDDLGGHGTLVATVVSSNALVFAGVNSRTRLMGIKVLGQNGTGSLAAILAGVIWAADHGADVANMSLGVPNGVDKAGLGRFVGLTNRVFNYANSAGMVVVVAAGNDARNLDGDGRVFSAYCEAPHVICVSATGPTSGTPFAGPWGNVDAFADYSDFGHSITLSAPGGSNFGYVTAVCPKHLAVSVGATFAFPCNVPLPTLILLGGAGTSAAAPHVTGVVAQLIAKYGKGNPSQIKQLLLHGVDDLGAPGDDPYYGAGRVNLLKAVSQ